MIGRVGGALLTAEVVSSIKSIKSASSLALLAGDEIERRHAALASAASLAPQPFGNLA